MAILSNEIVKFAAGNTDFYEAAIENYHKPTAEQGKILDTAFFAEIEKKSGVSRAGLEPQAWVSHPAVKWAALAVIDATITAILPSVLTPAFGLFMDIRFVGIGDIMKFRVMPNSLYTVSKGGKGERTTFRQAKHATDVIITPEEHLVTIYVDMYRVLAGKESISDFVRLVVLAVEQDMYAEAVDALITGLTNVTAGSDFAYTGAFEMKRIVKVAEKVQVFNSGVRPIIAGSATALMNVLPDGANGYRINIDGNGGSVNLIKNVMGFDVVRLEQAVTRDGGLILPDNKLFVVSPSQDKLVKGAVSSSLTNSNQFYENADITQNFTYRKNYDFKYASAAKAGIYTITN